MLKKKILFKQTKKCNKFYLKKSKLDLKLSALNLAYSNLVYKNSSKKNKNDT